MTLHIYHLRRFGESGAHGIQQAINTHGKLLMNIVDFHSVWFPGNASDGTYTENRIGSVTMHEIGGFRRNSLRVPQAFGEWVRSTPEDSIFHLHGTFKLRNYALSRVLRKLNRSYVFTPDSPYEGNNRKRRRLYKFAYVNLFEKTLTKGAAAVQALSPIEVPSLYKLGARSVVVIPNTVDIDSRPAVSIHERQQSNRVCFLGRIDPFVKGIDYMLEALHYARQKSGIQIKLMLIGPAEAGVIQSLQAKARSIGLSWNEAVEWIGPVYGASKYDLVGASAIMLQLSRWEGLPNSLLEALANGTPIIISENIPVDVEADDSCGGFSVKSSEEAAKRIVEILRMPVADYGALCSGAADVFNCQYGPNRVRDQLLSFYRSVRNGANSR